jgi:hypothetical protein
MHVRRLAILDEATTERLWELYRAAFAPLAEATPDRQFLHHGEFRDEMSDARVWKYVGFDEQDGEPFALATLTRHLEAMSWVSPEFFAARWPQEYAEGRVYYVGFVLVDVQRQRRGSYRELVDAVVRTLVARRAVAGFDISRQNDDVRGVLKATMRNAGAGVIPDVVTLGVQTYYAVTFRRSDPSAPPTGTLDGVVVDLTETGAGRP